MILLEKDLKAWMVPRFKDVGWYFQPIETSTKAGVPDVYCIANTQMIIPFWIELKVTTGQPLVRKEQRVWGIKHKAKGGISFFVNYNKFTTLLEIYTNPIEKVSPSGKYLRVHDEPARICNLVAGEFFRSISSLLSS